MTLLPNTDLFETVKNSLTETGFTFLYKEESNQDVLKTKGHGQVVNNGELVHNSSHSDISFSDLKNSII